MTIASWRPAAVRGFIWGALAGLSLVALMYLAAAFLGLRPLPQALSGPLLAIMPGFVFGFLIDTLQHAVAPCAISPRVRSSGLVGGGGGPTADIRGRLPRAQRRPDHADRLGAALRDLRRDPADGLGEPAARRGGSWPPAHARRDPASDRRGEPGRARTPARAGLVSGGLQCARGRSEGCVT